MLVSSCALCAGETPWGFQGLTSAEIGEMIAEPKGSRPLRVNHRRSSKMAKTRFAVGEKAASTKPAATVSAPSEIDTLKAQFAAQQAQIADLLAQIASKPAASSGRVYAPATTPREVAIAFIEEQGGDGLRDLHHLMVMRVPNSATTEKPYGTGVLEKNKQGQDQYRMKPGLDREHYIKLGKLAKQVYGDPMQYRKPQPLSNEQIDGILRPALDHLAANNLFRWES